MDLDDFKSSVNDTEEDHIKYDMGHMARKPVFELSNQVLHKLGCTTTEDSWRLEMQNLGSRRIVLSV